ncbi:hypothetical protein CLDAP_29350 [Caldilinea aerophila DSM 14535 = NBRC 104270]|uniref:Uncharacterized protein n=1 Tax=Caldilinea aerophila (strain DSM 14535 / JCM 11387 / NBRC 104270 / STL-6-O1) TaxID=926550 RepID=I0I6T7_CALAS|nr:hypothetical protein CLDAP_29350 [Caldilinea aerophila DSM 14535 = NBRC 104270]
MKAARKGEALAAADDATAGFPSDRCSFRGLSSVSRKIAGFSKRGSLQSLAVPVSICAAAAA